MGAFLLPKSPFTAPGETMLCSGSLKPVADAWQLEQDCPAGSDKFVSMNIFLPKDVFRLVMDSVASFSFLQAIINTDLLS